MSFEDHPARDNIRNLQQGVEVLRRIDDDAFTGSPGRGRAGGVGSQLRHCLDFYSCFLRGIDEGRIDYDRRERDPRVEIDRAHAAGRFQELIDAMTALEIDDVDREIQVRTEGGAEREWCRSSVSRELQFLHSHTVHHYALVVTLLELQGVRLDDDLREFGVAPSTLRYWMEAGA
jgi:uncharacterized damage-inducible protein DinB